MPNKPEPKPKTNQAAKEAWNKPASAPLDGTMIIGDFGYPWPIPAIFDPHYERWSYVTVQACPMTDGTYNHYLETDTESKDSLLRWLPMPVLPKTRKRK